MCARTAVHGAFLNVKINLAGLKDKEYVQQKLKEADAVLEQAKQQELEILQIVEDKI